MFLFLSLLSLKSINISLGKDFFLNVESITSVGETDLEKELLERQGFETEGRKTHKCQRKAGAALVLWKEVGWAATAGVWKPIVNFSLGILLLYKIYNKTYIRT